jgi:hypothetical protein
MALDDCVLAPKLDPVRERFVQEGITFHEAQTGSFKIGMQRSSEGCR